MRIAFVVGFFNTLETPLRDEFQREFDNGMLVFLGISSPRHPFNLGIFKSQLLDAAGRDDRDPMLVIAADMRNRELAWVRGNLEGIVEAAQSRGRHRGITLMFLRDAQNVEPVAKAIHEFKLGEPIEGNTVSEEMLRSHLNGSTIVCLRGKKQPSYKDALRRANFEFQRFEDYFVELELDYGSNVGRAVKARADKHGCLLYAWGKLKYLDPTIKDGWRTVHEGQTPAAAVARFKQAVLGQVESE